MYCQQTEADAICYQDSVAKLLSMIFSLLIYSSPISHQGSLTAFNFAKAALSKGHQIKRVFFYGDGVYNASGLSVPAQDESSVVSLWSHLATEHNIDLAVCISTAIRRGIIDAAEARRYELPHHNLLSPYQLSGLGQLADAMLKSDRLISFGA